MIWQRIMWTMVLEGWMDQLYMNLAVRMLADGTAADHAARGIYRLQKDVLHLLGLSNEYARPE